MLRRISGKIPSNIVGAEQIHHIQIRCENKSRRNAFRIKYRIAKFSKLKNAFNRLFSNRFLMLELCFLISLDKLKRSTLVQRLYLGLDFKGRF